MTGDLTPLVPLSFAEGEGEKKKRGAKPLLDTPSHGHHIKQKGGRAMLHQSYKPFAIENAFLYRASVAI